MTKVKLTEQHEETLYHHLMDTMEDADPDEQRYLEDVLDQLPEHDIISRVPDVTAHDARREAVCVSCGDQFVTYDASRRTCEGCTIVTATGDGSDE